jgi:hypothetical protein
MGTYVPASSQDSTRSLTLCSPVSGIMHRARRRLVRARTGVLLALLGVSAPASATVYRDPQSVVAENELLWLPRSFSGTVCVAIPGRTVSEAALAAITKAARFEPRGVVLRSAVACERPAAVLRVFRAHQPKGCPVRVVAEWSVAASHSWLHPVRAYTRTYEAESPTRLGQLRPMWNREREGCADSWIE